MTVPPRIPVPSTIVLRRATVGLVVALVVLLLVAVLPAERGIDPTGLGRVLGLTQMGEFKVEAARELASDAH